MSDAQIFDQENYLLAPYRSPGLEPVNPSLEVVETPPPIATKDSSLEPSEDEDEEASGEKRSRDQEKGDFVLIRQLDPNNPHAARTALKRYIDPDTRTQERDHPMVDDIASDTEAVTTQPGAGGHPAANGNNVKPPITIQLDERFDFIDVESIDGPEEVSDAPPTMNGTFGSAISTDTQGQSSIPSPSLQKAFDVKPPPRPPPITTNSSNHVNIDQRRPEDDSIAGSPNLARFTINHQDADPSNTLPALQMSPPRSRSNGSPDSKQTLPSLTTALSDAGTPFTAHSPNLPRASPAMSQYGPSPHSAMSPPSMTSNPYQWRSNTRADSMSTPSDCAIVSATGSVSTPASSILLPSPTSHPTPTAISPDATRPDGLLDQMLSPDSDDPEMNGFENSIYKCTIPDCTALPFQTQYLLNSHMNVHSDTRPHFCLVKNCPRGPGGQGFKRKNEMIRHGLVHTSPGYMCPFCPDQQHKYPRPDNLQRHVRVHHVDKDRDDAMLREVLAQRPEGGSRGRRRRLGS